MKKYIDLGLKLINDGELHETRTGTTKSLTGQMLSFDLVNGFPLVTTKYINFEHILHEVLWYLKGTDSIEYLQKHNIHIWDAWADKNNSIGKTYGYQWRSFNGDPALGDQWQNAITLLKTNPSSRRIMINGWNPLQLHEMNLPPCIINLHFIAQNDNKLDLVVYQRSGDYCLGVPYDIAEMALLLEIMSHTVGMHASKLTIFYGDLHIYENHIETFLKEQSMRMPLYLPKLSINSLYDADIKIENYQHHKKIKYQIAV